jgi:SPX domain protein involved in polyphosphate accumulation
VPLRTLLPTLPAVHLAFFFFLDAQLEKIDHFYSEKEKEARARSRKLENQLKKLEDHRRIFDKAQPNIRLMALDLSSTLSLTPIGNAARNADSAEFSQKERLDPDEYKHARKNLKKAVFEHYRHLEELNDYRVINITGFWKALKKYEKFTKVSALHAYMTERVDTSGFSSGTSVNTMINEMEELFAARFQRGDKKQATARLRGASRHRSHHSSTVRSGIALGLAVPAFAMGVYQSEFLPRMSYVLKLLF